MFENPGRGMQARNFATNVPKILDLKSFSEQIFYENWRWVPLHDLCDEQRIYWIKDAIAEAKFNAFKIDLSFSKWLISHKIHRKLMSIWKSD